MIISILLLKLFMYRIIGDVHTKYDKFASIVRTSPYPCVQLGDFGFQSHWDRLYSDKYINTDMVQIIMGNHDYLPYLHTSYSIGDFKQINSAFLLRGAESIDKHSRTEGVDWFRNEELTYQEGNIALEAYASQKPKVVIAHDCAGTILDELKPMYLRYNSRTNQLMDAMLLIHRPKVWVLGHHHVSIDKVVNGTRFICLPELSIIDIEL